MKFIPLIITIGSILLFSSQVANSQLYDRFGPSPTNQTKYTTMFDEDPRFIYCEMPTTQPPKEECYSIAVVYYESEKSVIIGANGDGISDLWFAVDEILKDGYKISQIMKDGVSSTWTVFLIK